MSGDDRAYMFYLVILLFFIGAGVLYNQRGKLSQNLCAKLWAVEPQIIGNVCW